MPVCRLRHDPQAPSRGQFVEQRLGMLQVERIEAFGERAVNRGEKIAGVILFALVAPESCHAHRSAQFERLCLLLPCKRQCSLQLSFHLAFLSQPQEQFASQAIQFRLKKSFTCYLRCLNRVVYKIETNLSLAKVCVRGGQLTQIQRTPCSIIYLVVRRDDIVHDLYCLSRITLFDQQGTLCKTCPLLKLCEAVLDAVRYQFSKAIFSTFWISTQ